jgi:Tfp pilus assembly protein PilZ
MEQGHFRGSPRARAECRVEVRRVEREGAPFVAYTSDIGVGGLCLELDEVLRVGERVELALTTPSRWAPLVLGAEVCWRKDGAKGAVETGFRFVDATEASTAALSDLAATLAFDG